MTSMLQLFTTSLCICTFSIKSSAYFCPYRTGTKLNVIREISTNQRFHIDDILALFRRL